MRRARFEKGSLTLSSVETKSARDTFFHTIVFDVPSLSSSVSGSVFINRSEHSVYCFHVLYIMVPSINVSACGVGVSGLFFDVFEPKYYAPSPSSSCIHFKLIISGSVFYNRSESSFFSLSTFFTPSLSRPVSGSVDNKRSESLSFIHPSINVSAYGVGVSGLFDNRCSMHSVYCLSVLYLLVPSINVSAYGVGVSGLFDNRCSKKLSLYHNYYVGQARTVLIRACLFNKCCESV